MSLSSCLVDTNVLLRLTRKLDPQYPIVNSAMVRLLSQNTSLYYTLQNLAELWNVMTRPVERNGFGLNIQEVDLQVRAIESVLKLLPDNRDVYMEWRRIIVQHGVIGVQVHDARLAAAMHVHGIEHILTFNLADFARFSGLIPVHPSTA
jgi:predicted nucleic acid-binding protein